MIASTTTPLDRWQAQRDRARYGLTAEIARRAALPEGPARDPKLYDDAIESFVRRTRVPQRTFRLGALELTLRWKRSLAKVKCSA